MATKKPNAKAEPNPYDDFDGPASVEEAAPHQYLNPPSTAPGDVRDDQNNPYLQFDGPAEAEAPLRDYKAGENVVEGVKNFLPDAAAVLGELGSAAWNWQQTIPMINDLAHGAIPAMMPQGVQDWMTGGNPEAKKQVEMAKAVGQHFKDVYGSGWENFERYAVEHPAHVGLDLSTVLAPGAGAIRGAATAAGVPARAIDAAATAANVTRVAEPVVQAAGKGAAAVRSLSRPKDRLRNAMMEGQNERVYNHLTAERDRIAAGEPGVVPGNNPTVSQALATLPDGPTRMHRVGADAEKVLATPYKNVKNAQGRARIADVDSVSRNHEIDLDQIARAGGGNPATMTFDEIAAARRTADAHNYGPINNRPVTADADLAALIERPSGDIVLRIAREIAAEEGGSFPNILTPASTSPVLGANGLPLTTPARFGTLTGNDLITLKKAYDRLASSRELRSAHSIDDIAAGKIRDTRNELVNWMEQPGRIPEHRVAAADHKAWRTLEARRRGMELFKDTLAAPFSGENQAAQRLAAFRNLFDSPRNAVKGNSAVDKATLFDAYDNWSDLFTPEELNVLQRNLDDLSRAKEAESLGAIPTEHAGELTNTPAPTHVPNFLDKTMTFINMGGRLIQGHASGKNARILGEEMRTLDGGINALEEMMVRQAKDRRFDSHARTVGRGARGVGRKAPAALNALNAAREERERRNNLAP